MSTENTPFLTNNAVSGKFVVSALNFSVTNEYLYLLNTLPSNVISSAEGDATVSLNMCITDFANCMGYVSDLDMNGITGMTGHTGPAEQNVLGFFSNFSNAFTGGASDTPNTYILDTAKLIALTATPNNCICNSGGTGFNWTVKTASTQNMLGGVGNISIQGQSGASGSISVTGNEYNIVETYESEVSYQIMNTIYGTAAFNYAGSINCTLMQNINNSFATQLIAATSAMNGMSGAYYSPDYPSSGDTFMVYYDSLDGTTAGVTALCAAQQIYEQMAGMSGRFNQLLPIPSDPANVGATDGSGDTAYTFTTTNTDGVTMDCYLYKMPFVTGDTIELILTVSGATGQNSVINQDFGSTYSAGANYSSGIYGSGAAAGASVPNSIPDYTFVINIVLTEDLSQNIKYQPKQQNYLAGYAPSDGAIIDASNPTPSDTTFINNTASIPGVNV